MPSPSSMTSDEELSQERVPSSPYPSISRMPIPSSLMDFSMEPSVQLRMRMNSSFPDIDVPVQKISASKTELPDIYSQVGNDLDVCLDCHKRMSDAARRALGKLEPHSFQSRGFRPHEVTCDFCARKGHEFAAAGQPLEHPPLGGHK